MLCRKPTRRQAECTHTCVPRRRCGACQREQEALPPRYLVKSRIFGCSSEADAPTAPPRSPPHNAGTASLTCSLSPPGGSTYGNTYEEDETHATTDGLPQSPSSPSPKEVAKQTEILPPIITVGWGCVQEYTHIQNNQARAI